MPNISPCITLYKLTVNGGGGIRGRAGPRLAASTMTAAASMLATIAAIPTIEARLAHIEITTNDHFSQ